MSYRKGHRMKANQVKRPTIYSIGYQKLHTPEYLDALTECLSADLYDIRSKPVSRKKGFGGNQLKALLGDRYQWHGRTLGGLPPGITAEGIATLKAIEHPVIVMCLEHAPGSCHRHIHLATELFRHGIDIAHIYDEVIIRASDLQAAIEADTDQMPFNYLEQILELGGFDNIDPDNPPHPPVEGPMTGNPDVMRRYGMTDAIK